MATKKKQTPPVILSKHQQDWSRSVQENKRTFILGCRRSGKTFWAAFHALMLALETNYPCLLVSKDERLGKDFLSYAKRHAEALKVLGVDNVETDSILKINLTNGAYLEVLPGIATALQGRTGHVFLDELGASREDAEAFMAQINAVTSRPYDVLKIVVITNATERGTWLHHFMESEEPEWEKARSVWKIFNTTYLDVPELSSDERLMEEIRATTSAASFERNYLNRFVNGEDTPFDYNTIYAAHGLNSTLPAHVPPYVIGIDVGVTNNPTGWVLLCRGSDGTLVVSEGGKLYNTSLEDQFEFFKKRIEEHKPSKIVVDAGSIGWGLWERLDKAYGDRIVKGGINEKLLRDTWAALKERIRTGQLKTSVRELLEHLEDAREDEGKLVRLSVVRHSGGFQDHCDTLDALLLAYRELAENKPSIPSGVDTRKLINRRTINTVSYI